jgi:DNA-binding IclR family transcriptional regulator
MPKSDIYYIEVIGKTLDVLEAFVRVPQRQLSLQEISLQLSLNKNSVFRILHSLAEHGYVVKENQKYELGPKLVELSHAKLRHNDLLSVTSPHLESLRDQFGETVNLGVLDKNEIRYIGVWESRDRFRLVEKVGAVDMLHCSALGKAYLACLPYDEVRTLVGTKRLPAQTKNTITSPAALKSNLEAIRNRGYAVDAEESTLGVCCIASAIWNPERTRPIAAFSISGPIVRLNQERVAEIGKALKTAAMEIQKKLGSYSPNPLTLFPDGKKQQRKRTPR